MHSYEEEIPVVSAGDLCKCKTEHAIASCAFCKSTQSLSEIEDAKVMLCFLRFFFITCSANVQCCVVPILYTISWKCV